MRLFFPFLLTVIALSFPECDSRLLLKRWAALSYGGERYQFKQSDEPMDPFAGTAYAGQNIPFQRDDPVNRQFYDQPNPYLQYDQQGGSTTTPRSVPMRDQPMQDNGQYMYYPYRTSTNAITSPNQVNNGK